MTPEEKRELERLRLSSKTKALERDELARFLFLTGKAKGTKSQRIFTR